MRRVFISAEAGALAVAAALSAMLFAARLPLDGDFILPRRGGYSLFRAAWALFSSAAGRNAFTAGIVLLIVAGAWAFAADARRSMAARPAGGSAWAGLMLGPAFAAFLTVRLCSRVLDAVQLLWFPFGSMDAREPAASFLLFALALAFGAVAARSWIAGLRRRATVLLAVLVAADLSSGVWAASRGVGRPLTPPQARGKTEYVVLTEGSKGPDRETYVLSPDVFNDPDPAAYYRGVVARADARTIPALRALYATETKRWDAAGLREALLLGCSRGDLLAPALLLAHLSAAAPGAESVAAIETLADERVWRVGPLGAAAISRTYAHAGDRSASARWAERSGGARGVPTGLLGLEGGGALNPGRISGTIRAPGKVRVALYRKSDAGAPYLLDASAFVAGTDPDARGRFVFTGLAAGRYYLAGAMSAGSSTGAGTIAVSGHRGDILLDVAHPALALPQIKFSALP